MEYLKIERGGQSQKSSKERHETNSMDSEVRFFWVTSARAVLCVPPHHSLSINFKSYPKVPCQSKTVISFTVQLGI